MKQRIHHLFQQRAQMLDQPQFHTEGGQDEKREQGGENYIDAELYTVLCRRDGLLWEQNQGKKHQEDPYIEYPVPQLWT